MPSVGLVLGGGGLVGQAFQAGALAAIEHDHHWDPRTADVIVGTSAGSVTGTLLAGGLSASDLAAHFVDAPESVARRLGVPLPVFAPIRWHSAFRPQLPRPELIMRSMRQPWLRNPIAALSAMLPDGAFELLPHLAFLGLLTGSDWPSEALRVTATRQRDGRRVVFGAPDAPQPDPTSAVAASCAIPGYFRPVEIDGQRYLDGGLRSATNCDVIADESLDLTIVVSPLSTKAPVGISIDALARRVASRQVRGEVAALERRGHNVVLVEPSVEAVEAMGADLMCAGVVADTVREAFLDLGREATRLHPVLRDALAGSRVAA